MTKVEYIRGVNDLPGEEMVETRASYTRMPSRYRRAFLQYMLKKCLQEFVGSIRLEGIEPDFSLASLIALESRHFPQNPSEHDAQMKEIEPPLLGDYAIALPAGAYLGETLVRRLGGMWRFPNRFLVFYCMYTGYIFPIFRRWYVVVNGRKVPVFEHTKMRLTTGPSYSLARLFTELANARGEENSCQSTK